MRRKRIKISSFLSKLYDIVSSSENNKVIKWNEEGDSFQIVNFELFCNELLPKYFKHRNFASFVRQLNMYDFHKKKSSASIQEFSNVNFLKGKSNLLKDIKRKVLIDSDKEYYQPYKRIRKISDKEPMAPVQSIEVSNDIEFNDNIEIANKNIKQIEEYCREILKKNKKRKEEIKALKLKEKNEEKILFDIIGSYKGVEYDLFRKKKLMNKNNLLVEIFNEINHKEQLGFEYNKVKNELYPCEKEHQGVNERTQETKERFKAAVNELYLKQKKKRDDNTTNDILKMNLKMSKKGTD